MKVSLVAAPMLVRRCPLIGLGYIAAYVQARGHEVRVFDLNVSTELPEAEREHSWGSLEFVSDLARRSPALFAYWALDILSGDPDIVAFTTWSTTVTASLILAGHVRRLSPRVKIVLGGPQAGFDAENLIAQPQVDAIINGEGEESFACLLDEYARAGRLTPVAGTIVKEDGAPRDGGPREEIADLDTLPFPDYSQFPRERYFIKGAVPASFNRGCVRRCVFCNIYESWKAYRHRGAESLVREFAFQLERYPDVHHFEIDVAALNLNVKIIDELCDRIIASGLKFTWAGSAVFRPDDTLARLKKMAQAGCNRLDIGLESASPKVLRLMKKGYVVEHAERMLRDCREAGIEVNLNVIVGFPGETEDDFRQTIDFLGRNRRFISNIGPPNELWIGNDNYLERHPEQFGVKLAERGELWESTDGSLTHAVRADRARRLQEAVAELEIGIAANDAMRKKHEAREHAQRGA